jgi:hypothetical protein
MADLKEVVDRIRREGELTRNDGRNSLASVRLDVQNVVEHIRMNMEDLIEENKNIGKLYEKQIDNMDGQRYDLLETIREQRMSSDRTTSAIKESNEQAKKSSKKKDGPGMFSNLFKFFGATALFKKFGRFLRFGGIIGAAVGTGLFLFDVFRKVANDPRFEELKTKFQNFKDRVKEDVKRISDALGIGEIPPGYFTGTILDFGSNLTTQLADQIIETGNILMDPDKTFMQKLTGVFDRTITNFVQIFNPDAYSDGSFVDSLKQGVKNLGEFIVMKYDNAGLALQKITERVRLGQLKLAGEISEEEYEKRINELDFKFRNREQVKADLENVDAYLSGTMSNRKANVFTATSKFKKLFEESPTGLYEYMTRTMTDAEIDAFLNSDKRLSTALKREFEMQRNMYNQNLASSAPILPMNNTSVAGMLENLIQSGDFGNVTIIQDNSSNTQNNQGGGAVIGSGASTEDLFYKQGYLVGGAN